MKRVIILIVLALAAWWAWGKFFSADKVSGPKSAAVNVSVATAARQDVPLNVSLAGNVIAYETVAVKSRLDSQIIEVKFADGDAVQQGQVLFVLDDRTLRAQLKELEAGVNKERAQMENFRVQYERARALFEKKIVAQAQLDTAKAAYNAQLASVNATQAGLENTRVLLSYTTITAPISGRAGTINVTRGNNVKANDTQPLVTINRVSPIRVQFAIPERYYAQVKAAMAHEIAVRATQEKAEPTNGTLEYIDNTIDPSTGTFTARAIFTNEKETLWPGMFVNVSVELGRETGVITVPSLALQGDEGQRFVFKVVDGKAVKTPVETSQANGEVAIITQGVSEGDTVIIDGLLRITDGSAVTVGAPKPPAQ